MSRHLSAVVCATALLAMAGCGGGGKSTARTQRVDTSSAKTLCPAVLEAQKKYTAATEAMGLQFENKPLVAAAVRSLEQLRLRLGQLQLVVSEGQRRTLAPLSVALSNQLLTIQALAQHDVKTAAKYGNSINVPLRRGMIDLRKICSNPG